MQEFSAWHTVKWFKYMYNFLLIFASQGRFLILIVPQKTGAVRIKNPWLARMFANKIDWTLIRLLTYVKTGSYKLTQCASLIGFFLDSLE